MKVSPLRALTLFLDSFIVMAFAKHIGSSRRTPYGRTPLTESGLAAFPHPALCETNRSHLSIIYTDIYSGSYQWITVIYHIQKFYPVVAFLLAPPI